jgi:hypothetical protein
MGTGIGIGAQPSVNHMATIRVHMPSSPGEPAVTD